MTTRRPAHDQRRFRLAANDNETIVADDVAGHAMTRNDNETIVSDETDVEGHRLATNDAETTVRDDATRPRPEKMKEH